MLTLGAIFFALLVGFAGGVALMQRGNKPDPDTVARQSCQYRPEEEEEEEDNEIPI